jgi:hypothetical protein
MAAIKCGRTRKFWKRCSTLTISRAMPTRLVRAVLGECVQHLPDQHEVIRFGSLSPETQLLWHDFRNLSTCTIFCGGL